ncbi:MAG: DMT family transporter [Deltaproteobacteria bacterium]|nr:DMT family transporter [Deltaproteobacteria bacterium]
MSGLALGIVLLAALFHAGWNFLAKNSRKKIAFIWWFLLIATIGYLPMFMYFWPGLDVTAVGWICIIATGILHALYFWFMGGAYERGDLSLVYPLSRGSGPLLVPILAVIFLQEQISLTGAAGIVQVVLGIYIIHLKSFTVDSFFEPLRAIRGGASLWALCTGGTIAGYSLVDKVGVSLVYPPAYIYLMFVISLLLLSPYVLTRERAALKLEWQINRGPILIDGFLVLFTYMMILFAFRLSKVSYVVAAREVSIVFSALLGIFWLKEAHAPQKIAGSVLIALGVVFIGLSK